MITQRNIDLQLMSFHAHKEMIAQIDAITGNRAHWLRAAAFEALKAQGAFTCETWLEIGFGPGRPQYKRLADVFLKSIAKLKLEVSDDLPESLKQTVEVQLEEMRRIAEALPTMAAFGLMKARKESVVRAETALSSATGPTSEVNDPFGAAVLPPRSESSQVLHPLGSSSREVTSPPQQQIPEPKSSELGMNT